MEINRAKGNVQALLFVSKTGFERLAKEHFKILPNDAAIIVSSRDFQERISCNVAQIACFSLYGNNTLFNMTVHLGLPTRKFYLVANFWNSCLLKTFNHR